jgi:hypothetical protein
MSRSGVFLSPKIQLYDYRSTDQGRGLIANENISVLAPVQNHLTRIERRTTLYDPRDHRSLC